MKKHFEGKIGRVINLNPARNLTTFNLLRFNKLSAQFFRYDSVLLNILKSLQMDWTFGVSRPLS